LTIGEATMRATEKMGDPLAPFSDPDDPQFAPIRADLARLYMRHRVDLGLALASDQSLVANTDNITATLWCLSKHALDHNDVSWLRRHRWWIRAAISLHHGECTTALDG
jgi:hypothetical protein